MITPICIAMQVCRWNMILCIDFSLKTISTVVTKRSKKKTQICHIIVCHGPLCTGPAGYRMLI